MHDDLLNPPCPVCGLTMTRGAIRACGPNGGVIIPTPPYCTNLDCKAQREEEAIAEAIEKGLIDP